MSAIGRVKIRGVNLAVEWVDGEKEERGDDGWTDGGLVAAYRHRAAD